MEALVPVGPVPLAVVVAQVRQLMAVLAGSVVVAAEVRQQVAVLAGLEAGAVALVAVALAMAVQAVLVVVVAEVRQAMAALEAKVTPSSTGRRGTKNESMD